MPPRTFQAAIRPVSRRHQGRSGLRDVPFGSAAGPAPYGAVPQTVARPGRMGEASANNHYNNQIKDI